MSDGKRKMDATIVKDEAESLHQVSRSVHGCHSYLGFVLSWKHAPKATLIRSSTRIF